jgi:hypothetical protein
MNNFILYEIVIPNAVVILGGPISSVSKCSEVEIYVKSIFEDRKKGIREYEWDLVSMVPSDLSYEEKIGDLLAFFSSWSSNMIRFPANFLKENSVYTISLTFRSTLNQRGTVSYTFNT